MSDVIAWLESPEGMEWSRNAHCRPISSRPAFLVTIKDDAVSADYAAILWRV